MLVDNFSKFLGSCQFGAVVSLDSVVQIAYCVFIVVSCWFGYGLCSGVAIAAACSVERFGFV